MKYLSCHYGISLAAPGRLYWSLGARNYGSQALHYQNPTLAPHSDTDIAEHTTPVSKQSVLLYLHLSTSFLHLPSFLFHHFTFQIAVFNVLMWLWPPNIQATPLTATTRLPPTVGSILTHGSSRRGWRIRFVIFAHVSTKRW